MVFASLNHFRRWWPAPWNQPLALERADSHDGPDPYPTAAWRRPDTNEVVTIQRIIRVEPLHEVAVAIDSSVGPSGTNTWRIEEAGTGTRLTGVFEGRRGTSILSFLRGAFAETLLGPQYEYDLRRVEQLVESLPRASLEDVSARQRWFPRATFVYETVPDSTGIKPAIRRLRSALSLAGAETPALVFTSNHEGLEVGFRVPPETILSSSLLARAMPESLAMCLQGNSHVPSNDDLIAHAALTNWETGDESWLAYYPPENPRELWRPSERCLEARN